MNIFIPINNLFRMYTPSIGKNKEKLIREKKSFKILKREYKNLYNPIQQKYEDRFIYLFNEIITIQKKLEIKFQSIREEFYLKLLDNNLNKLNYTLDSFKLKTIYKEQKELGNNGIQAIDISFKKKMLIFNHKSFKFLIREILKYEQIADIINCDLSSPITGIEITNMMDLYFLLPDKNITIDNEVNSLYELLNITDNEINDINRLLHILLIELGNEFIENLIIYNLNGENKDLSKTIYSTTFINEYRKKCLENYKIDRVKFLEKQSQSIVKNKIKNLFNERELIVLPFYNHKENKLLIDNNITTFKFIDQICIVLTFFDIYFKKYINPPIKEILLEADFFHKDKKMELQRAYDKYCDIHDVIIKLPEDIKTPSYPEIEKLLKALRNGLLNDKEKLEGREIISKLNKDIDELLNLVLTSSMKLGLIIEELRIDILSTTPTIISNTYFFERNNSNINEKMDKAGELFTGFHSLLRSVYIK